MHFRSWGKFATQSVMMCNDCIKQLASTQRAALSLSLLKLWYLVLRSSM